MPILARGTDINGPRRRHCSPVAPQDRDPISHRYAACHHSRPGRSHPAAYRDGPLLQSVSLLELLVLHTAPANIPRAGGNPTNPAVTSRVVVLQAADRSDSWRDGRMYLPTPTTPTCTPYRSI